MTRTVKRKAASATGQRGSIGETFVKGVLEEMLWGPVPVAEHDSGTDFFVQVRDEKLTELGLLLGVQVKNESRYFAARVREKAEAVGYWEYQAKQSDADYWLEHTVPHLMVLFDQKARVAYWGHVTRDAVRYTNRAARIRVPTSNALGPTTRAQLLDIAAQSRRYIAWSPATWQGVTGIQPTRRLRTALLAPRVAAPRHMAISTPVAPETAIARLMLGRFPGRPGRPNDSPPPGEGQANSSFASALYHAFWTYLTSGDTGPFELLATAPAESHEKVALAAVRAAIAVENGDPAAALSALDSEDLSDVGDAVDRAWLDAHRSRCLRELGDDGIARELALKVAATGLLHPFDHGAVALRAAVLNNTFLSFEAEPSDRQLAASASDSPPVWWRDQHRSEALAQVLDRTFNEWANPASPNGGTATDAWDRLRGITLNAGLTADHRAWCLGMSQLSRYELSSGDRSDVDRVAACLDDLRNCGDKDAVTQAVTRLILDGPVEPLRKVTEHLDATRCTRTNLTSSLEVFKESVEVLADPALERHTRWILQQLKDPSRLPKTDNAFRWLAKDYLLPTLREAYRLLSPEGQELVKQHLVTMVPVPDQLLAESYATLVRTIPHDDWTDEEIRSLRPRAEVTTAEFGGEVTPFGDHPSLGRTFNATLAHAGDGDRLTALYDQLAIGNWQPLSDLGAISDIPSGVLSQLVPHLVRDLDARAKQAAKGMWTGPAIYSGNVLLIINCTHPDLAQWDPLIGVLEGGSNWDQAALAQRLVMLADLVDEDTIDRLGPLLSSLADRPDDTPLFNAHSDTASRTALLELTTRLDDPESVQRALSSGPIGKKAVAHAIARRRSPADLALLMALSTDSDASVRSAAAGAATTWQQHAPLPAVQSVLDSLLQENGFANAYASMRAIKHEEHSAAVHHILVQLSEHPSAGVRWRAAELLRDPENCRCGDN